MTVFICFAGAKITVAAVPPKTAIANAARNNATFNFISSPKEPLLFAIKMPNPVYIF
jgi:hypothetical protein